MKFAYILNPAAGNGRAGKKRARLERALRGAVHKYTFVETQAPGHATELARELARDHDAIVAIGGDGTIQEVVRGLVDTPRLFGVLPLGTGNDFAKMVGMPTRIRPAVRALASAAEVSVDLGRVRYREEHGPWRELVFANAVGIGFDAMAAYEVARYKHLGGTVAYLAAVLKTLNLWGQPEIELTAWDDDGELLFHEGPFFLASVSNGISVGGGFYLTPGALIHDGLLDLCLIDRLSISRVLRLIPRALRGRHTGAPEVTMLRARRFLLRSEAPLPIHADGETLTRQAVEVEVEVLPGAQRVLAPRLRQPRP